MPQLTALLTIRQEAAFSEYSFSYTNWRRNFNHSWVAGLTSGESEVLQQCLQAFAQKPTVELVQAGGDLLTHLFAPAVLDMLWAEGESLAILSDEQRLPWEWVGELFRRVPVTRDLSQRPSSSPLRQQKDLYCVIGDVLTRQSGVDEDIDAVSTLLKQGPGKLINGTPTATRTTVEEALRGDRFGLLYLVCPGLESVEIGGGIISPLAAGSENRTSPRFVWFHHYLRPVAPEFVLLRAAAEWAQSVFSHGGEAFLVNLWSDSPREQRRFARTVASGLADGKTLGEALLHARQQLWERKSPLACAYYLFGNPQLRLGDCVPMRVRESTTVPGGLSSSVQLRVLAGPEKGRIVPLFTGALRQRGLTLGSSGPRGCDIEFEDTLPNLTASLAMHDDTLVLSNLTGVPGDVQVNGLPVRQSIALSGWERILLGSVELQLESSDPDAVSTPRENAPRAFCLEVHDGDAMRTEWHEEDLVTVGRGQGARILFSDPSVSRTHALLQRSGSTLQVARLGSSLVAVNGVPAAGTHALAQGDLVQLSDRAYFKVLRVLE
jgi:hypothetical protein